MSKTLFNEIINSIQPSIIDSNLTITAIDLEFITAVSASKAGKFNPSRDLVRYQFLEIFVRLAIHKYHKSKICKSKLEAIQKFFDEDIGKFLKRFHSYEWREKKYFCEEVEIILKDYAEGLDDLFKMYSGRYTMPSKPKFVSLEEFTEMVSHSGILSLNIANKDIGKYFNLAMETQVDEIDKDKHMQMFKLEFYEAIARIAEKAVFNDKEMFSSAVNSQIPPRKSFMELETLLLSNKEIMRIEDDEDDDRSDSASSASSAEAMPDDDIIITRRSTIIQPLNFKNLFNKKQESRQDNSVYSLGDGDKLYQKLEKLLQMMIKNCFKRKMKRLSNKQSNQLSLQRAPLSVVEEDIKIQGVAKPQTPSKNLTAPSNNYRNILNRNLPIKAPGVGLQLLSVNK